jgi:16S rRNA (cytidine1402-2'-O)-methyltransferase
VTGLADETRTMIFYESPFRLVKTLTELAIYLGSDRNASVSRELSKMFEENIRGTLSFLSEYYTNKTPKGEIVIIVAGKKD